MSANSNRSPRRRRSDRSATDRAFDDLVPDELRKLSDRHWTPVEVAIRVVKILSPRADERILDVGSGIGKLCVIGALSSGSSWYGVESSSPLVLTAERLARALGVADRTTFFLDDAFAVDWETFDILYLYNPFELPLFPERTDARAHDAAYRKQVGEVEARLSDLPTGTRVVTLHGFGGRMPPTYALLHRERIGVIGADLAVWVQRGGPRRGVMLS